MAVINPYNYSRPKNAVLKEARKPVTPVPHQGNRNIEKEKQDQYLAQKVMSAKPEELTMMLYEGLVRFIKLAKQGVSKGNVKQAHENSIKAQDIVVELSSTLDMNFEFSNDWLSLYDFILEELSQGNISKDEKRFDNALEVAEGLAETWRELMKLV